MEQAIETLLNDFEHGRLNRRQLIKHLAMVAAVASPVAAAAQGASAKAPWKTVHLDHISYSVSHYKKSASLHRLKLKRSRMSRLHLCGSAPSLKLMTGSI